ncbi:MAG: hypothetical protein QM770_02455 [Tepidisphaeraceae bacterium]
MFTFHRRFGDNVEVRDIILVMGKPAIAITCLLLGGAAWFVLYEPTYYPPELTKQHFRSAHLEFRSFPLLPDQPPADLDDPVAVQALASLLESASQTQHHRCSDFAILTFRHGSGPDVSLRLLPGHDREFYEYRRDGLFRVDRRKFITLLEPFHVPAERFDFADSPTTEPATSRPSDEVH